MNLKFLVTGGAGYVGSHLVALLHDQGGEVVVIDNLRQGHRAAIPPGVRLVVTDVQDGPAVDALVAEGGWHAVFHFAALSLVGESMREPMRYFRQNAAAAFSLIESCVRHGVPRFVLSSTAAVFGIPEHTPIVERARINPESPYGESKLMIERALRWADQLHGMRSACLRYFNAAGADPAGRLGEDHLPETHLIPLVIDAALGRREDVEIFGMDWPSPDGTCIRDYVHVTDLADAHMCAMAQLDRRSVTYNLGNGAGHSVHQVVAAVTDVTGRPVPTRAGPRRDGDPMALVAASDLIRAETGWSPRYADLREIVRSAYAWRLSHPKGYDDRG